MGDNNSEKSIGWIYKGEVLHPYCFQKQWVSSDNIQQYYEEFIGKTENYYHSKKFEDFSMNIGKYWGEEINSYELIKVDWGEPWEEGLEYAVSMKSCLNKKSIELKLAEGKVSAKNEDPLPNDYYYKIVNKITPEQCQELAPNIDGVCEDSFMLYISSWSGGSMGYKSEYSIFGLFKLSSNEEYIFPLKKFKGQKEAESFIGE